MLRLQTCLILLLPVLYLGCNKAENGHFRASGIVEGTAIRVAAQTPGLILHVAIDEGQQIKKGQLIAQIDTVRIGYQLEQIQAGIEEIAVQRQIILNTLTKAQSDFANVEKRYARILKLYHQNSAPQQKLDDVEAAQAAATAQLQNVRQSVNVLKSKEKGLLAQRKLVRKQLNDATVTAPISGTITTKFFESGETVPPGVPLVEIIDLAHMWTKIYVSEKLLSQLQPGNPAEVSIDGTEKTLTGRIAWISPKAEFTPKNILTDESRTSLVYAVKITVENPNGLLKHGMPIVVNLVEENKL